MKPVAEVREAILLPNYGSDFQYIGIKTNIPIKAGVFYWRGKPHIVGDKLEWDGQSHLYDQELVAIKGETNFHVHRFYNGICYLCGYHREKKEL